MDQVTLMGRAQIAEWRVKLVEIAAEMGRHPMNEITIKRLSDEFDETFGLIAREAYYQAYPNTRPKHEAS